MKHNPCNLPGISSLVTANSNMKRKLSSIIAMGLAAVSADTRNHIRGAHLERDGRKRSNADGPHAKPSPSFEQIRRIQTQTAAAQHHLCIYSEFAKGSKCDQLWRDRGHAALMRISQLVPNHRTHPAAEWREGFACRGWTHPAAERREGFAGRGCAHLMAKMRGKTNEYK